jgi:hypothetical protein
MDKRQKGEGQNFRNKYLFYFLWVIYKMSNCENVDCLNTASALRRLRDGYSLQCGAYAKEVDIKLRYEAEIRELNMEMKQLREAIRTFNEVFDAIYEFDERRFNQLKITKDKIEAFKTKYVG